MNDPQLIPADNAIINTSVFAAFLLIMLFIVYRVSSRSSSSDYFVAGSSFTGPQNGMALAGDYLSAASCLGITGAIAVYGYDGFLVAISATVSWLVILFLIAEPTRNTGRFTMGDVLSFRMRQRPVRAAAASSTLAIVIIYMISQIAGAGGLIALLLNIPDRFGQGIVIAVVGAVMMLYVLVGGMKGTTWVQIIKAALLVLCAAMITVFLLGKFGFSMTELLRQAADNNPQGDAILAPGGQYKLPESKLDMLSSSLALVLGAAGLPHVLMRFYTVPNAREARRSTAWVIWVVVFFYACTMIIGYGAGAMVGREAILKAPGGTNSAVPLLAYEIGGTVLLGIVAAVAFATIVAVVAGLTLTASVAFAHDIYANVIRRGDADPRSVLKVARSTALIIGVAATLGSILVNGQNIVFLAILAFALAASANLPTLLLSLFWKRFNTTGTLWSVYGGLGLSLVLMVFSPVVSGAPDSILPHLDFAFFPLKNPGLVSIPLSFLCAIIGTYVGGKEQVDEERQAEMEVRALTGIGARVE